MLVRCLLPMELDTGPLARKSSTLCSLLLLLTIAAFAVPGQANSEEVGLGKHNKTGDFVTLVENTKIVNETDFNSADGKCKELYPGACDVTIENGYIELRYNYGSKGCTIDLLSKLNNTIKFKTGVRNTRGGINKCLDESSLFVKSYNNTLPFIYSVNNKIIEKLNNGSNNDSMAECKATACKNDVGGECMPNTTLQVSWSKSGKEVYAHTHLIGEEKGRGLKQFNDLVSDGMTLELEIKDKYRFTMNFLEEKPFNASDGAVCVPEKTPLFEPKTWIITNGEHIGKHLLVFSLLQQNASFKYEGDKRAGHPNGPHCELFIQFNRTYYELLLVPPPKPSTPAPTTTATTKISTTGAKTSLETSKCAPCLCALASTTPMAAVKTTKCPSTETKSNSPVLLILFILVLLGCVITNVIWFYLYKKDKDDKEKQEEEKKAKSIVKSTKGSLYEPDVNTAIQMDVGNAKTASEAGKSTTAGVDVEKAEADAGESKAGEDALNAAATKTLNEV